MWQWFFEIVIEAQTEADQKVPPSLQVLDKHNNTAFKYLTDSLPPDVEDKLDAFDKCLQQLKHIRIDLNTVFINSEKRTMLHEAKRKGHDKLSAILLKYDHGEVTDDRGITPSQRDHRLSEKLYQVHLYSLNCGYNNYI